MKNEILIVGAGREGKGYLGNVFSEGGWSVSFLDKDPAVVDALKGGRYEVKEYRMDDTRLRAVEGYRVFLADERQECLEALEEADVVALCLYPEDVADAVSYLIPMLKLRAENHRQKKLTIIPCTNEGGLIPQIERQIQEALNRDEIGWYKMCVRLADAVVRRPVGAKNSSSLYLEAGVVCPMLVGTPIFADFSGVPWIDTCGEDIDLLKKLKVHTINTAHAACAYAGYLRGYASIDEAKEDPQVAFLERGVLEESVPVLAKHYHISEESLWKLALFPRSKEPFEDPVVRVALDPLRKLSRHDRLTENARLCLEAGTEPVCLIQSIANGMAYDAPGDAAAQTIQEWIEQEGIETASSRVMGLPVEDMLVRRVAEAWRQLSGSKKQRQKGDAE